VSRFIQHAEEIIGDHPDQMLIICSAFVKYSRNTEKEIECDGTDWINLSPDIAKTPFLVNTVKTFGFHKMQGLS
jgi:hypothetical protein